MKYPVKFFVIILITICSISKAENLSIVYLNMDQVMNQSIPGISLNNQLDKIHKANLDEFKINFEITSHCQAKCPACPRIFFKNRWNLGNHMKFEDFKSVVDLNEKIAKESCCYFAGELGDPILHPEFHRILTYASSKFDIVEVSTNGGARTSDWFHNIMMKLKRD